MALNAIAIIEVSEKLPEFIAHLKKNNFHSKWKNGDGGAFTLPKNSVWKRVDGTEPDSVLLKSVLAEITNQVKVFNETSGAVVKIENLLVVPSNPWAALIDEVEDETYRKFKELYLVKYPHAEESEIKAKFKLL